MAQRIVFVAPFGLRQKTTIWARILPLAHVLNGCGWQVTILIPPWDSPQDAGKSWLDGNVQLANVKLNGGLPLILWRLLHMLWILQPDIIHIVKPRAYAGMVQWLCWYLQPLLPLIKRNWQPRIFLDIDDWEQAWASINGYPIGVAQFLAWQEEWGIRHAHGITSASRWLEARARHYATDIPNLYLPNGVALQDDTNSIATPLVERCTPMVLFFTRFVEVAPNWLVRFWRILHEQMPTAELVIAGEAVEPQLSQRFREEIEKIEDRKITDTRDEGLQWLGYVEDPAALYAKADCAIFPAENTPLMQAKCSVKLATALLHGVPVVASDVGEQAAYGAEGAAHLLSADATPEEFAQAVITVLQNPQRRQQLRSQAHQHLANRYDWLTLGQKLDCFLHTHIDGIAKDPPA